MHGRSGGISLVPTRSSSRHVAPRTRRELLDGCLLQAGYTAYWKRDLASAQRLFRKAAMRGFWHLRDAKYVLPSLLPPAAYRRLVAMADRQSAGSALMNAAPDGEAPA